MVCIVSGEYPQLTSGSPYSLGMDSCVFADARNLPCLPLEKAGCTPVETLLVHLAVTMPVYLVVFRAIENTISSLDGRRTYKKMAVKVKRYS